METVSEAPLNEGIRTSIAANYDAVSSATIAALASLNVTVKSSQERPEGLIILVSKDLSAFSWGEVGRIFVQKSVGDMTNVYVRWEKRYTVQVTGTDAEEFSAALSKGINTALSRK